MKIDDLSVLVTGGASGLGGETGKLLHSLGARVTLFDRDGGKLAQAVESLGDGCRAVEGDVSNPDDVAKAVEAARQFDKPLRVVINCAGIGIAERTMAKDGTPHSLQSFERVIRTNLIGTFNVLRISAAAISLAIPLENDERGLIINTASIAAFDGQIGQVAYSASKGGVVSMTLPAARDLSSVGIRVMCIAPGIIDTPLLGQLPSEVRTNLANGVPFPKRLGHPSDYAQLVKSIIENGYLNGEVIRLDGALRMAPR